jgi:hypothetical protein
MVATQLGVQKISGITMYAVQERKHYEPLQDIEVKYSNFSSKFHLLTCWSEWYHFRLLNICRFSSTRSSILHPHRRPVWFVRLDFQGEPLFVVPLFVVRMRYHVVIKHSPFRKRMHQCKNNRSFSLHYPFLMPILKKDCNTHENYKNTYLDWSLENIGSLSRSYA